MCEDNHSPDDPVRFPIAGDSLVRLITYLSWLRHFNLSPYVNKGVADANTEG